MASITPNWSTGNFEAPDVGKTLIDFSKQQADYADRMLQRQQLLENQRRWELENKRAQTLADRQTEEFEREKTLRGVRKDIASEFTSSPYAAKWGADKVTSTLDKLVNQEAERRLAAGEAPFSEEEASQLQAYYETARPYKEDAVNSIAARLVAEGEDAVKAKQEAEVLASGTLLSKADQQARLDAQQKMYQDFYGSQAKANLDAAKLNQDYDIAKMKMYGGTGSGGSGSGGSGFAGTTMLKPQETIEKWDIGLLDSKEAMGLVNTASTMGYTPWQIQKALENSVNLGVGEVISDKKVVEDKFKKKLLEMSPGQMPGSTGGGYSASNFMPQFAPRQIAGYDPEGFARDALRQMPWLVGNRQQALQGNTFDASKYGDFNMDRYITKAIKTESDGDSTVKSGSYQGLMQLKEDDVKRLGYDWKTYLKDPKIQEEVGRVYTADNVRQLERKGLPVNDFTVYMAHNQGVEGARQILSGNPSKEVMLNMLNQGIPNDLPKYSNGQINIDKVMKDDTITADYLNNKYNPVEKYINKFSKKFEGNEPNVPQSWPSTGNNSKARLLTGDERTAALKQFEEQSKSLGNGNIWDRSYKEPEKVSNVVDNKAIASAKADYLNTNGGLLDDIRIVANLMRDGNMSKPQAEQAYEDIKANVRGDRLRGYRDYLTAKRTGVGDVDQLYSQLTPSQKIGDKAWIAPIVAATAPAGMAIASLFPTATASGVGAAEATLGAGVRNAAMNNAAEYMNMLRSPSLNAGQIQQAKDTLQGIARQYPELRTDIVRFLQALK